MKVAIREYVSEEESSIRSSYVVSDVSTHWCDIAFLIAPKPVGDPPHYMIYRRDMNRRFAFDELLDVAHSIPDANAKSHAHAREWAERHVQAGQVLDFQLVDETERELSLGCEEKPELEARAKR